MADNNIVMEKNIKKVLASCAVGLGEYYLPTISRLLLTLPEINTSDSESEDEEKTIVATLVATTRNQPIRINKYFEKVVANYSLSEFQQNFRLTYMAYRYLLPLVEANMEKSSTGRPQRNVEEQLLATIWVLATPDSYRSISERFNMTKSTLSITFFRIVRALNKIAPTIIKWPNDDERSSIKKGFEKMAKLKNVIGAIDGTYIPIKAPKQQAHCYTNRKKFHSITLQAVCDHRMRFLDCSVGYPSSVHDCRVFKNSDLYSRAEENIEPLFGNNSVILGDKAYPVMKWCIPPFLNYGSLSEREKKFNKAHAETRQVVERGFALLFGRLRRLHYVDMNLVEQIPFVVMASCVLHNICLMFPDESISDFIQEGTLPAEGSISNYNVAHGSSNASGIIIRNLMAQEL